MRRPNALEITTLGVSFCSAGFWPSSWGFDSGGRTRGLFTCQLVVHLLNAIFESSRPRGRSQLPPDGVFKDLDLRRSELLELIHREKLTNTSHGCAPLGS